MKSCDEKHRKCTVVFEDKFEMQIGANNVHIQLDLDELKSDDNIVCCLCDDGASEAPNEIIICDTCQQGYHVQCHEPKVDREQVHLEDDLVEWTCATCKYISAQALAQQASDEAAEQAVAQATKKRSVSLGASSAAASSATAATPKQSAASKQTTRQGSKTHKVKQESRSSKLNKSPKPSTTTESAAASRRILRGGDNSAAVASGSETNAVKENLDAVASTSKKVVIKKIPPRREQANRDRAAKIKLPKKSSDQPPVELPETPPVEETEPASSDTSTDTEHLPCGAMIEKMPSAVIKIAKKAAVAEDASRLLVDPEETTMSTDNFLHLIEQ